MLKLEKRKQIYLLYYEKKLSQRKIAKHLQISRETVSKYINKFESIRKSLPQNDLSLTELWESIFSSPVISQQPKKTWLTDSIIKQINSSLVGPKVNYTALYLQIKEDNHLTISYDRFYQIVKDLEKDKKK